MAFFLLFFASVAAIVIIVGTVAAEADRHREYLRRMAAAEARAAELQIRHDLAMAKLQRIIEGRR